jgi:polysaccharide export outer membrane protein
VRQPPKASEPSVRPDVVTTSVASVQPASRVARLSLAGLVALTAMILPGCETDSWFDPSVTGYWEFTPSTMPVLRKLDIIERETTPWGAPRSKPTADDLQPGELEYRLTAGDEIRVEVFELVTQGQTEVAQRTVDPSGNIRIPTLGEVPAAGLTVAQVQKEVERRLQGLIQDPLVSVSLVRGQGFSFTIHGAVVNVGIYGLTKPDFRLMDAIALAGGSIRVTKKVYVIRAQPLLDSLKPSYGDRGIGMPGDAPQPDRTAPTATPPGTDIESLINKLESGGGAATPPTQPSPPPSEPVQPSPGMLQDPPAKPPVDVDELQNPVVAPTPSGPRPAAGGDAWIWDSQKQQWTRGPGASGAGGAPPSPLAGPSSVAAPPSLFATRIIEVDFPALVQGDANVNVVIRPGDQIYVEPPPEGFVWIGGQINRPGVYEVPRTDDMTLSRLIDTAGGLGQIAIPQRVDLVRDLGNGREAIVRVNLAAIRQRSEPDILMKPGDHVIIGTNFFATPLAVIRNGFRMTYGFGFLLDRNFGNDVFGPPPESNPFN